MTRVKDLQNQYNDIRHQIEEEQTTRHQQLMKSFREAENEALQVLIQVKKKKTERNLQLQSPIGKGLSVSSNLLNTPITWHMNKCETPKMLLSAYKESPLIKKIRPMQIAFVDFECEISKDDFEKIPS